MKTKNANSSLAIKIFADSADLSALSKWIGSPWVKGFTTNPSLLRKAGVTDYTAFATKLLSQIRGKPVSLQVLSQEPQEIEQEALTLASWGKNVYVKIPVSTVDGKTNSDVIRKLSRRGVKLNVTAILALDQVRDAAVALDSETPSIISVFAGRVADTGRDPVPHMSAARELLRIYPHIELLWASTREVFNLFQAQASGCDLIAVPLDLLEKLPLIGKDLHDFSGETVRMFANDARAGGYSLPHSVGRV